MTAHGEHGEPWSLATRESRRESLGSDFGDVFGAAWAVSHARQDSLGVTLQVRWELLPALEHFRERCCHISIRRIHRADCLAEQVQDLANTRKGMCVRERGVKVAGSWTRAQKNTGQVIVRSLPREDRERWEPLPRH